MSRETKTTMIASSEEAAPGTPGRFGFGANWTAYLRQLDDDRVAAATAALVSLTGRDSLAGVRLLDIGCGSGIHSLAALRLGADVTSFDFDLDSVACTAALRQRYAGDAATRWHLPGQGSILDLEFVTSLGRFDIVYSWGVLHHTGALRRAIDAAVSRVEPTGQLVIALYNDQGWISDYWTAVKRWYNTGHVGRVAMTVVHLPYLASRYLVRRLTGKRTLDRGMSLWHDYIDWLGGYPFDVASPAAVSAWLAPAGFTAKTVRCVGRRQGCNEYVFVRTHVG